MRPSLEDRIEVHRAQLQSKPFPGFGHALKPYYGFDESYVALNNGSFGACPNHVLAVYKEFVDEAERYPDTFLRRMYRPLLTTARKQLAEIIHCHVDDLVLVANATSGVNAVLRGLNGTWRNGDAILVYETIYGACGKTAQYIVDSNPSFALQIVRVPLSYPLTHDEVIQKTRAAIEDAEARGINIRIGVMDAISSIPGVVVPWERLCKLFRSHNVLSLVDAAHAVGQIEVDMTAADPDFFISNCHKWLSAHRGVALLYVAKRNQHLTHAIPTSHDYLSPNLPPPKGPPLLPTDAPSNFVATWEWTGTIDMSNYLSIPAALEFRRWMGGEAAIMAYNSNLAQKAGEIVSQKLGAGSVVMEVEAASEAERLTASMVNVSIPVDVAATDADERRVELAMLGARLQTRLTTENETFVMFYVHADRIWIRLSAQVWLEPSDFEWVADKIQALVLEHQLQTKATI